MTVNNGSLVSGRVPVTDYANLTADRYQFLNVAQAEPNLGPGADNSVLVITTNNTRSWSNSLTLTGNVSANYFIGNGSLLTGIFTTITNQTFQGDGSTIVFTLSQTATAVSILVTINGITQTPDVDYLVISNILTFMTAPAIADVIQVRFLSNNSVSGTYSNVNVAAFLPTYTGNIAAGNISATGNIQGQYILGNGAFLTGITGGGNANTGNVTFDNINIIGTGNLHLQPDPANTGSYLDIFLTSGPDLHLVASASANLILGKDNGANVMTSWNGNAYIQSWNLNTGNVGGVWTFGGDGQLTTPDGTQMGAIEGANTFGFYTSDNILQYLFEGPNNVTWGFNVATGGTGFPTLNVQRGDNPSGTIQGQTLLFGDATKEAIITTPNGVAGNEYSQRLVINPGAGYDYGEGGDIYLWAGRGGDNNGSGGDIKIRGGQGMADGTGGYIRIEGGDTQGAGYPGYIDIKGGQGGTTQGAYVRITGGQGATNGGEAGVIGGYGTDVGGDANITAGYGGTNQGGNVNITGGGSALGLSGYGNVNINAGASSWHFDNTGNLTLPSNTFAVNYANGNPITFTANTGNVTFSDQIVIGTGISNLVSGLYLAPSNSSANVVQYLRVRGDVSYEPTHIHFDTGNNQYFNQFIGDDNKYVLLSNTGNIVINTSDYVGNSAQWTFDTFGNLTVPDTTTITAAADINLVANSDGNISGLQVNGDANANLYAHSNVVIYTNSSGPGNTWTFDNTGNTTFPNGAVFTGYDLYAAANSYVELAGDTGNTYIGVGQDSAFIQTDWNGAQKQWSFDSTGNLTLPTGGTLIISGDIVAAVVASPAPTLSGFSSVSAITVSATGNISATGNVTAGNILTGAQIIASGVIESGTGFSTGGYLSVNGGTDLHNTTVTGNVSATGNVTAGNVLTDNYFYANGSPFVSSNYGNANVATFLAGFGSNTVSTTGNITSGNLITSGLVSATGNVVGNNFVASGSGGALSGSGNITGGNLLTGGLISATGNVQAGNIRTAGLISTTGNITTAGNFVGNGAALTNVTVSVAGNIVGTQSNVTLVAGVYNWSFNNTGNLTLPGNTFSVNYANNTPVNVVTRFESLWTVPTGNSTQSFTVTPNETYYMWVDCNIPNGILTWNATATVTNTNVPVVGAQYAWVYNGGGTPIDFTSIPNQFIGTANTIVRSSVAPSATTNRFDFGINNTSGNSQTVRYGWIQIS